MQDFDRIFPLPTVDPSVAASVVLRAALTLLRTYFSGKSHRYPSRVRRVGPDDW
jgi:hypothetical protein